MQRNLFLKLNKQIFCTIDEWHGLKVEKIREMEEEVKFVLNEKFKSVEGVTQSPETVISEISEDSHVSK